MIDSTGPVVVDTDVVSYLFNDHSFAPAYERILAGRYLAVSLTTIAEIEYGMALKNWGSKRRTLMRRHLSDFVCIFPDIDTAETWARLRSAGYKKGRQIESEDAWIAATALRLNIPLVTNNVDDFRSVDGLTILSAADPEKNNRS